MSNSKLNIIPEPSESSKMEGHFIINPYTTIIVSESTNNVEVFLINFLNVYKNLNLDKMDYADSQNPKNVIILRVEKGNGKKNEESYDLIISKEVIQISADYPKGLFYGVQTLIQLILIGNESFADKSQAIKVPCSEIRDSPRFQWRGFMLDEARHFFGKKVVKKILDLMALLKFNMFHWHLTDDQGWRVEIKKYPRLIEVGSKREGTMTLQRKYFTGLSKKETRYDNIPVEGYYTLEDLKEIIQYANDRFITIIPEIDFPGHVTAALASYPRLSCTGGPFEVSKVFGIHKDVFCIGNNEVYNFCQEVLDEIMTIFPSKYIHVGGDEVPTQRWKKCEKCQAKLKEEGLTDVKNLQPYFTSKLNSFIKSKNHTLIGWNEILNDNLDIDAICQYWINNFDVVITHIKRGRKVIMSEISALYLNYPIELLSLQQAYVYDPIPPDLEERYANNILGLEACLWTEYVKNREMIESMIFPRILAVSELGWTSKSNKNFERFQEKLSNFDGCLKYYMDT